MAGRRDDEEQHSGGDELFVRPMPNTLQTRPTARARNRRERRLDVAAIVLAALLVLIVIALLTDLVASVALPIVSQDLAAAPTITTAPWIATQQADLTPTSADWYTFQVYAAGFQVDVPGVIGSSHAYFINDFSGMGSDFYYAGDPLSSPLQQREAKVWVKVLYSTRITDRNICPQGGTAITLGFGKIRIPAWQRNEGRIVALNLVLNGTAIEIDLDSRDNAQPALMYYGDIWQHMLVSFAPLSGSSHPATHPC